MDIQVAIIAGGLATRLGELTKSRPKSLVEVNNKPFLAYQLEILKAQGIVDVVLCLGHLGEQIRDVFGNGSKYGVHISYSLENRPLGTAGALKHASPLLAGNFVVMYGDSYLFLDLQKVYAYFLSQNKLGLVTALRNHNSYDESNMVIGNGMALKYSKFEKSGDMVYIDYGASIFNRKVLQLVPENQPYSLEDLFVRLIKMEQLLAFEVKDRFYEIGSKKGLQDFEGYIKGIAKS
jgi:NDP-sugar pyrophosphorylase family protein